MKKPMKFIAVAAASLATGIAFADAESVPEVTSVNMVQGPGSRLVTITYTLSSYPAVVTLDIQTNAVANAETGWTSIGGEYISNARGDVWRKVDSASGTITWRPDRSWRSADGGGFKVPAGCSRAVVTAWALNNTPDYMVVDISPSATSASEKFYYPGADFLPGGIIANTDYRQNKLVMRKILAKGVTFMRGSSKLETGRNDSGEALLSASFTNNYYIGVFEMTQAQWANVYPTRADIAEFTAEREMRPMESIAYTELRYMAPGPIYCAESEITASSASASTYGWPNPPHGDSFLGKLRSKTGLDFDLPSESQWEYACRAGHGSGYWGDGSAITNATSDASLAALGRYAGNVTVTAHSRALSPSDGGTNICGSYEPNSWGLYDMHGNVDEFCLDTYSASPTLDAAGVASPAGNGARMPRGGKYAFAASSCRPAFRPNSNRYNSNTRARFTGFRVVCTAGLD